MRKLILFSFVLSLTSVAVIGCGSKEAEEKPPTTATSTVTPGTAGAAGGAAPNAPVTTTPAKPPTGADGNPP